MVTNSKAKSRVKKPSAKKDTKVLELKNEKNSGSGNATESNVSVITKNTNPRVIIQSENVVDNENYSDRLNDKHLFLKLVCFIVMCIILLITFFLSLKTYNAVNDLSDYVHRKIQP